LPIPLEEFDKRIDNVRTSMREEGLSALIAYADTKNTGNVRYLANYSPTFGGYESVGGSEWIIFGKAAVVVPVVGDPTLVHDCGFAAASVKEMSSLKKVEFSMNYGKTISEILGDVEGRIGVSTWDKFPHSLYLALKQRLPRAELTETLMLEKMRMIKSPNELVIMRRSAELIDEGTKAGIEALEEGKTEKDIWWRTVEVMEPKNPEPQRVPPTSVVLFGSRTSTFGLTSSTKLRKGDTVVFDLNNEYEGYCSDLTRTKVFGAPPTREQNDAYAVLLEMYKKAFEAIRPGAKARAIWDVAEKVAKEAGYGEHIRPCISHGIGLDIHEIPDVGVDETLLARNMVISLEPMLCMKDFGVGAEDTVLVTEGGREALTKLPKDLEM
jgi:Xaa-Pro aminopeptidase